MVNIRFVAMERWPGKPTVARKNSRFDSPWSSTIELLDRELTHLSARDVVIQADCGHDQVRLDGHLRANARLRGPGVIISFKSKGRPLSFPCDRFSEWQDNVRAIALTLEHLRAVDRYGVTQHAEQYTGWAKLPSPETATVTLEGVEHFLRIHGIDPSLRGEELRRASILKFAPDRNDGDDSLWKQWLRLAPAVGVEV